MRSLATLSVLLIAFVLPLTYGGTYDDHTLVNIHTETKAQYHEILSSRLDITDKDGQIFKAILTDAELTDLAKRGFKIEILYDEMDSERATRAIPGYCDSTPWPCYYFPAPFNTVNPPTGSLMEFLLDLNTTYPAITRLYDIGDSEDGAYDIIAMKISKNPDDVEAEPKMRIYANIHGDETGALMVTCDVMETLLARYASSDPDAVKLIDEAALWFIPQGNPWGMANQSRYNSNSVDLNRNFDGPDGYDDGSAAFSEAETQAIRDLTEVMDKRFCISVSSHGGAICFNAIYNYTTIPTSDESIFFSSRTGGPEGEALPSPNGLAQAYYDGNTTPGFWYTNGGDWYVTRGDTNDWSYSVWTQLDTTLEVTATKWPDSSEIPSYVAEHREAVINYLLKAFQGVHGIMKDQSSGTILDGTVTATATASTYTSVPHVYKEVYTDPVAGDYHRILQPGTYTIECNATGYPTYTVEGVEVSADTSTFVDCLMNMTSLKYNSSSLTDNCSGTGSGGDGILDAGESAELQLTLNNPGYADATNITATITTTTPGITINNNTASFPDIAASGSGTTIAPHFSFSVDETVSCGTEIVFTLTSISDEGSWQENFTVTVGDVTINNGIAYSQNFDSLTAPNIPADWAVIDIDGTRGDWTTETTSTDPAGITARSASNMAVFNSATGHSGDNTRFYMTSGFAVPSATSVTLTFWMYHDTGYSSNTDRIQPQISTDGSVWTDEGSAILRYDGSTGWKMHSVDLTAYQGMSDVRLAFFGLSDWGNDCHIDDVEVSYTAPGTCDMTACTGTAGTPPGEVSSSGTAFPLKITKDSSTCPSGFCIYFEENADATGYNIYEGTVGTWYSHDSAPGNICNAVITDLGSGQFRAELTPSSGNMYYLVTAFNGDGEGTAGSVERDMQNSCAP